MNDLDRIQIRTLPDRPKHRQSGSEIIIAAFVLFVVSWPMILLMMLVPGAADVFGLLLYLCGPLPIIPAALFVVGFVMSLYPR